MITETILDGIITHERLVTHDINSFAGRCQHFPVSRLWSASWLLMLEMKCTNNGRDRGEQTGCENKSPVIWGAVHK